MTSNYKGERLTAIHLIGRTAPSLNSSREKISSSLRVTSKRHSLAQVASPSVFLDSSIIHPLFVPGYREARDLKSEYIPSALSVAFGFGAFKEERISVGTATPGRQSRPVPLPFDVYPLCPLDPFSPSFWLSGAQGLGGHLWTSIKYRNEPSKSASNGSDQILRPGPTERNPAGGRERDGERTGGNEKRKEKERKRVRSRVRPGHV